MEHRRAVSILQRVGTRWLLVTELNPHVVDQKLITELSGEHPDTVKRLWDLDWSIQVRVYFFVDYLRLIEPCPWLTCCVTG